MGYELTFFSEERRPPCVEDIFCAVPVLFSEYSFYSLLIAVFMFLAPPVVCLLLFSLSCRPYDELIMYFCFAGDPALNLLESESFAC